MYKARDRAQSIRSLVSIKPQGYTSRPPLLTTNKVFEYIRIQLHASIAHCSYFAILLSERGWERSAGFSFSWINIMRKIIRL